VYDDFFRQDNDFGSDADSDGEQASAAAIQRRDGMENLGPRFLTAHHSHSQRAIKLDAEFEAVACSEREKDVVRLRAYCTVVHAAPALLPYLGGGTSRDIIFFYRPLSSYALLYPLSQVLTTSLLLLFSSCYFFLFSSPSMILAFSSSSPSSRSSFTPLFSSPLLLSSLFLSPRLLFLTSSYHHSAAPSSPSDASAAASSGDKKFKMKVSEFDAAMVRSPILCFNCSVCCSLKCVQLISMHI
jgi:hypothetical protein